MAAVDGADDKALRSCELSSWYETNNKYPHFSPTTSIKGFYTAYEGLEPSARSVDSVEALAGRIVAKRQGSKSTCFLDIESGGERIQVLAIKGRYVGDSDRPGGPQFTEVTDLIRRGDVIGARLGCDNDSQLQACMDSQGKAKLGS